LKSEDPNNLGVSLKYQDSHTAYMQRIALERIEH
jgi:hypothetical protein